METSRYHDQPLHEYLRQHAREQPGKAAYLWYGRAVTFAELDRASDAFAARLAPALKVRGGTLRYIQRKLAARYLPPQILNRPKQGFSSALPYLLQREYAQLYSTCLRDSRLVRDRFLDGGVMSRLIDEHLAKRADHGNRLWLLINAEVWYRMAILGQSKEETRAELMYAHQERKAVGSP